MAGKARKSAAPKATSKPASAGKSGGKGDMPAGKMPPGMPMMPEQMRRGGRGR